MPMIRTAVEARFPGKVQIEDPDRAVAKGAAIYASMLVEEIQEKEQQAGTTGGQGGQEEPGSSSAGVGSGITTSAPTGIIEDQTPRSFGPGVLNENMDYIVDNIIKMGDVMPASAVKTYFTAADNMEKIVLRVFENMCILDSLTPASTIWGRNSLPIRLTM